MEKKRISDRIRGQIRKQIKEQEKQYVMGKDTGKPPVEFYRKARGYSIKELAERSGISRQTIGKVCSGEMQLKKERLQRIADVLHVDCEQDLEQGSQGRDLLSTKMINIEWYGECLKNLLQGWRVQGLPKKARDIAAYLAEENKDVDNILSYILTEANEIARWEFAKFIQFYREDIGYHENYNSKVQIGYMPVDSEEGKYQAYVLFENWVYDEPYLELPFMREKTVKDNKLEREIREFNFDIEVNTAKEPETEEFKTELIEQVKSSILSKIAGRVQEKRLAEIFVKSLMEENEDNIEIRRHTSSEFDRASKVKIDKRKKREEEYTKLIEKIQLKYGFESQDVELAEVLAKIRTQDGYEKQVFEQYSLDTSVLDE